EFGGDHEASVRLRRDGDSSKTVVRRFSFDYQLTVADYFSVDGFGLGVDGSDRGEGNGAGFVDLRATSHRMSASAEGWVPNGFISATAASAATQIEFGEGSARVGRLGLGLLLFGRFITGRPYF